MAKESFCCPIVPSSVLPSRGGIKDFRRNGYSGTTATNPAVSRALLTAVSRLLDLELDVSPFEAAVRAFQTQYDQAVAQDAAVQAYVRQLEQAYDAPGAEEPRLRREDDFNPEQLMHELEDFLRQERERGAE
jgi:hypothetical protein